MARILGVLGGVDAVDRTGTPAGGNGGEANRRTVFFRDQAELAEEASSELGARVGAGEAAWSECRSPVVLRLLPEG